MTKRVRDLRFHRRFAVLIAGEEALSAAGRALVNHLLHTDGS
jgi:hypothetical protein